MIVCIAEKPSVAYEIAKILGAKTKKDGYYEGNGYQVTWTFGHLCQLKSPDAYRPEWKRWTMAALPIIPAKFEVELIGTPSIKKQFKVIKSLYRNASVVINCGDAGQEGELIQRWVMQLAGVRCPVKRLWISSLTEEAIQQGFRHLKPQSDYDKLYEAGQARAEGDWLLGMNATRFYTLKHGDNHQVLSVGRVQTPTLAMIVSRDNEIEHFQAQPFWVLTTRFRDTLFTCTQGRFSSEEEGRSFLASTKRHQFVVKEVLQKRESEPPPLLYDLTSLQMDCNCQFGFSADTTLKIIQNLYEKKLTTYPRVDTKYLSDDLYARCPGILKSLATICSGARYLIDRQLPKSKRVFDSSKITDHHAIIPSGNIKNLSKLNDVEMKVFCLVAHRFCAAFYPNCEYAQTVVIATAGQVGFKATGRTILNEGWRAVYGMTMNVADHDESEDSPLPTFCVGENGRHIPALAQKTTTPPKRYTEASLLRAMESLNIGRPSSRAAIIETLLKRNYVRREKHYLISTATGRHLLDVIQAEILKSPELTALWEKKLHEIEQGHYTLSQFMEELQQALIGVIHEK